MIDHRLLDQLSWGAVRIDPDNNAEYAGQPDHSSLTIAPGVELIADAIEYRKTPSLQASQFRAELGLDPSRPVIMSGHQAEFWHPGILAKFLALQHAAARTHAQAAWLVVDQDTGTPWSIRYPIKDGDSLFARTWHAISATPGEDVPLMRTPAINPADIPTDAKYNPQLARGLQTIHDALKMHADAPNAAGQFAPASIELASKVAPDLPLPKLIFASDLARTTFYRNLVSHLASSPSASTRVNQSYNAARSQSPRARIAALAESELPFWRIGLPASSPRRPATFDDAARAPDELFPRALLFTGLVRALACDLFIHGTGGAGASGNDGYDRITQAWFADWLKLDLAPALMVTATLHLHFPGLQIKASAEAIHHAQWLAHTATHLPGLLDDTQAAQQRGRLLEAIQALKSDPAPDARLKRRQAYQALHDWLATWRSGHAAELAALAQNAQSAAAQRATAAIAADRTWAFPLYEPSQLRGLSMEIAAVVNAAGT